MLVYEHVHKNESVALPTFELIMYTLCISVYVLSVHVPMYMHKRVCVCVYIYVIFIKICINLHTKTHTYTHNHRNILFLHTCTYIFNIITCTQQCTYT